MVPTVNLAVVEDQVALCTFPVDMVHPMVLEDWEEEDEPLSPATCTVVGCFAIFRRRLMTTTSPRSNLFSSSTKKHPPDLNCSFSPTFFCSSHFSSSLLLFIVIIKSFVENKPF